MAHVRSPLSRFIVGMCLALVCCCGSTASAASALVTGLGGPAGFGEGQLLRNDDSFQAVSLTSVFPSGIRFFGTTYTDVFVNNNGNLTFGAGSGSFVPDAIDGATSLPIIAAFYADVDTRAGGNGPPFIQTPGGTSMGTNLVYYDFDAANRVITFTWDDVGYYSMHDDLQDAFQIRLLDRGNGDFDIEFRYEALQWTTGDASGGVHARAGYSSGNGVNFYEFPQSGNQAQMLDLVNQSNIGQPGVFIFPVRTPHLTITPSGLRTNASPISFLFNFGEDVTGFTLADIAVSGGTAGAFASVTGSIYSLDVAPAADGTVSVSVAANAALNSFGNGNLAGSASVISDRTPPTVAISPNSGANNLSPIPFVFTFNEAVTGFTASDVTVTNGTTGALTGSGASYTLQVVPAADGVVSVSTAAAACTDLAGNALAAGASASVTSDRTPPVVTITPAGISTNANTVTFTFTFAEPITSFAASGVTVANGTAGVFAGSGTTYTLAVAPTADGPVTVTVGADSTTDLVGNGVLATGVSIISDRTPPTVAITPVNAILNGSPYTYTFTFSEPVTGFTAADVNVTNGTKGPLAGSGSVYTIDITPTANGAVSVGMSAGTSTDLAGNLSPAASVGATMDSLAYSVAVTPTGTATNQSPITFTFTFAAAMIGFDASDIVVGNGVASAFSGSGAVYSLDVTPSANGPVTVDLAGGDAVGPNGHPNITAHGVMIYDTVPPIITVSAATVTTSPFTVTLGFSEPVSAVSASSFIVGNGVIDSITAGPGNTFIITVTPISPGAVTFSLPPNTTFDAANNGNTAQSTSVDYAPSAAFTSSDGSGKCGMGGLAIVLLAFAASFARRRIR